MSKFMLASGILVAITLHSPAAETVFSAKPEAKKSSAGVLVTFTVSKPIDVEVAVLDSSGTIVRHLAAGMLGGSIMPPEPLKQGLSQSIVWDLKNDVGVSATGGPFKIRVRAGMRAELDGFVAESKHWIGTLTGLAIDPKGDLYVLSSSVEPHRGYTYFLQVFNRKGEYQRTIMPMPANLPREGLKAFGVLDVPGTAVQPVNRYGTWPQLYPMMLEVQTLCSGIGVDGLVRIWDGKEIARITSRGVAADGFFSKPVFAKTPNHYGLSGSLTLALSPDGNWIYLSGMTDGKDFPEGVVYRMKNDPGAQFEPFVRLPVPEGGFVNLGKGTSYPVRHCGSAGVACDAAGNVLVCDRMQGSVRVYAPDGKELGGFKVDWPDGIACDRKTGAVYVMINKFKAFNVAEKALIKLSNWKEGKELARLPFKPNGYNSRMVLDDSAQPAVLWASGDLTGQRSLLRIEDRGNSFEVTDDLANLNKDRFGVKPRFAVHPDTDLIICNDGAASLNGYEGLTGKQVKLPFEYGSDMTVGLDGNWYVQTGNGYSGYICRFDRELKPIAVESPPIGGSEGRATAMAKQSKEKPEPNALGFVYGRMGAGYCTVGMAVDQKGRVFSMQMGTWSWYCVAVYGPDGNPEDPGRMRDDPNMKKVGRFLSALVGPIDTKPGGIQVDFKGNIYVGLGIVPKDHKPPAGFEKDEAYKNCVGSVVKFSAAGGSITKTSAQSADNGLVMNHFSYGAGPRLVENGQVAYPGLGCLSGAFGDGCMCRQPMFQVDGYGRIFYPNAITNSVRVTDNAGNELLKFGQYGNIDSAGPQSMIPTAEVPLGWPEAVAVSHKAIYVSDVLNRRIVRLKKTYEVEEACALQP